MLVVFLVSNRLCCLCRWPKPSLLMVCLSADLTSSENCHLNYAFLKLWDYVSVRIKQWFYLIFHARSLTAVTNSETPCLDSQNTNLISIDTNGHLKTVIKQLLLELISGVSLGIYWREEAVVGVYVCYNKLPDYKREVRKSDSL